MKEQQSGANLTLMIGVVGGYGLYWILSKILVWVMDWVGYPVDCYDYYRVSQKNVLIEQNHNLN